MIKIQNLTVKNFMSVGNITQAVDFSQQHFTLVLGENLDQGGDDNGSRNGTGKSQPLSANILTPNGWCKMKDIKVGDKVFAHDGTITTVTGVFPQGKLKTYRIIFEDGRETRASEDHLWSVYSNRWFKKNNTSAKTKILTTGEIASKLEKYTLPNGKKNSCAYMYAPLPKAIEFEKQDLKIDPWLLGFLLGDGSFSKKHGVGFSSADDELIEKTTYILKESLSLSVKKLPGKYDYGIIGKGKGRDHPLRKILKEYNLNGCLSFEKSIPEVYKHSSIEDRIKILQGLFDSDGTVDSKTGTPSFTSTSLQLANDVAYIIRSLGGIARISKKIHQSEYHRDSYTVSARTNFSKDLFSLTRKKDLVKDNYQYKNQLRSKFVSIEPDIEEECQCIQISHPDRLYITDNFVVTHNTTIVNALSYALFGQALTNIKRNNLINKTNNKNMLVTLTFEKNDVKYRIERGRSPNVLKFFKNNEEQKFNDESQGDSRDTQNEINDLLGMSHTMFKHIVALNTYTEPFLSMRANDQREIIEQLLGITILSDKAVLLKEQIKQVKDRITEETIKINAIQSSNEKIQNTIDNLGKNQRAWQAKKRKDIEQLQYAINELEKLDIEQELVTHEKLQSWSELNQKYESLSKEKSTLETALLRAEKSVEKIKKDILDLNHATCYTCGQELHLDKKQEIFERKTIEENEAVSYFNDINLKLENVMILLNEIGELDSRPNTFYDTIKEAYEHRNNVSGLVQSLESKKQEIDPYQEQINELEKTALQDISWDKVNDLVTLKEHQEFLLKLLTNKDSFIRKKIIDQNLLYLNNRLTYYLDSLGLPHQVQFQNDLSVEITQLGQDLDFDNLSRGERNRLILGLSFAFRDVWESLYQNVNLLFIDELIDSGMDGSGVENALSVLKKLSRERSKNIFLISHKDELIGRVNNVLKVIKENGFTSYDNDLEITDEL